jgi:hypothetical protein
MISEEIMVDAERACLIVTSLNAAIGVKGVKEIKLRFVLEDDGTRKLVITPICSTIDTVL